MRLPLFPALLGYPIMRFSCPGYHYNPPIGGQIDVEKSIPHYVLAEIQAQMKTVPDMNLTVSARSGIRDVGMARLTRWKSYRRLPARISIKA
jgi:hypothetical protein